MLSGSVAASALLGPVSGELVTSQASGGYVIAICQSDAASCTDTSPEGGIVVPAGSYEGVCHRPFTPAIPVSVFPVVACTLEATPCFGRPECPWQDGDMITYIETNWGEPFLRLRDDRSAPGAREIVNENQAVLLEAWHEHFSGTA